MSNVDKGSAKQRITDKIKASAITNRLQSFALAKTTDKDYDKKVMSTAQVTAGFRLLAKVVPDLKQIEHKGDLGVKITKIEETIVDPKDKDS